jgi:hypothetical protein
MIEVRCLKVKEERRRYYHSQMAMECEADEMLNL